MVNQVKEVVLNIAKCLKRKYITNKQLLYIYNMVIIPKLEYLTQIIYITEKKYDMIMALFRMVFKHKLSFSTTAPNSIMDNQNIYNFRNLYDLQIQSKITNFLIQINAYGILGIVTEI